MLYYVWSLVQHPIRVPNCSERFRFGLMQSLCLLLSPGLAWKSLPWLSAELQIVSKYARVAVSYTVDTLIKFSTYMRKIRVLYWQFDGILIERFISNLPGCFNSRTNVRGVTIGISWTSWKFNDWGESYLISSLRDSETDTVRYILDQVGDIGFLSCVNVINFEFW